MVGKKDTWDRPSAEIAGREKFAYGRLVVRYADDLVWSKRLAICLGHRQTGNRHWLAQQGLPLVLDLESSPWPSCGGPAHGDGWVNPNLKIRPHDKRNVGLGCRKKGARLTTATYEQATIRVFGI
jgi:hypothetical protein